VSNMTPAKPNADSPPLHMVPGHSAGEKRKAQLAVSRHPSPRPALAWLRKAAGCAKRFAAVALAMESVLRMTEVGTRDGDLPITTDEAIVTKERTPPERRVRFTSPVEHVKDEAFQVRDRGAELDPILADGLDEGPLGVGSGGFKHVTAMASDR
jgi:hypothetical protein